MDCLHIFQDRLRSFGVLSQGRTCLLGVSGGIDSVVLCALSKEAGLPFAIAHCNFGLRGGESDRDEAFVRSLAQRYAVPVYIKKIDAALVAREQKMSIQEAARKIRYDWFDTVRAENGYPYTLLAHHANDNIETLLMHFFRGTGLDGLTGMPELNTKRRCLRPLLTVQRQSIEQYAKEKELQWVEDSSNASDKYTRNFFRNTLLPQLKTVFPMVEDNLLGNLRRLGQTKILYTEMIESLKKKIYEVRGEEVHIPVLKLMKYKDTSLLYEVISDFGFTESYVAELEKLAKASSGKYVANDRYRIIRHQAWFIIAPQTITAQTFVIEKEEISIRFDRHELFLQFVNAKNFSLNKSAQVAQLNAASIEFPLVLRPWKQGDYFYPLGMQKKKKLARFFIDQKLSKTQKEKVWVVESHKRIVWVVGYRIDDRFKVTENTKEVLQLSLSSL